MLLLLRLRKLDRLRRWYFPWLVFSCRWFVAKRYGDHLVYLARFVGVIIVEVGLLVLVVRIVVGRSRVGVLDGVAKPLPLPLLPPVKLKVSLLFNMG